MSVGPTQTPATDQEITAVTTYQQITDIIKSSPAMGMSATYAGGVQPSTDLRKLWPHVLGTTPDRDTGDPVEMVLCYQYQYENHPGEIDLPHPSRKNFRCFRVSDLTIINPIPKPTGWSPFKFKIRHVNKQNCVQDPDIFR